MALVFDIENHSGGVSYTAVSGTLDNLVISGAEPPDNLKFFLLNFYSMGAGYVIDVGFYIEWETAGVDCTSLKFDFPMYISHLIPVVSPATTNDAPISPVRIASFFENSRDPLDAFSWLRFEKGRLEFYIESVEPVNLMKAQSEFRYQKNINRISML